MSDAETSAVPPKPPARRGRGVQLLIALAAIGVAYVWANRPTGDSQGTGAYEPAPPPAAPEEDTYEAREIPAFPIAIEQVPMDAGVRWQYAAKSGQTIAIDYLVPDAGVERDYQVGLRLLNDNPLYTMYVKQEGNRIVERTDSLDGTVGMAYEFPLEVGKTWSFVAAGVDDAGAPAEVTFRVTVEAAEEITVPNGTYPCLRLHSVAEGTDSAGTVLWYAADVGTVRLRTADGGVAELVYFGPIPPPADPEAL